MDRKHSLAIVFGVVLAALLATSPICAQTLPPEGSPPVLSLQIMLSTKTGAPTAQQVVNGFQGSTTLLQGLSGTNRPQSVTYLLQKRAQGDFLSYLQANPNTARAKLERFLVSTYSSAEKLQSGLIALQADPYVQAVTITPDFQFSSAQLQSFSVDQTGGMLAPIVGVQYGRDDLNVDAAWALAGGYALVGDINSGLATSHPDLRPFSASGQFLGGNFLPAFSQDIGSSPSSSDVDEAKLISVPAGSGCDDGTGHARTFVAGHGTHVAGLIAANSTTIDALAGTCAHCGIMEVKISYYQCTNNLLYHFINPNAVVPGITYAADNGAQVINQSFGGQMNIGYCLNNPGDVTCIAIDYATTLGIVMTAASGNARIRINFPASDPRVIATGGYQQSLVFWDLSPGNTTNCPPTFPAGLECGSNYTTGINNGQKKQELVASANQVLSTTYPGLNWNNNISCGDSYGPGTATDGIGWCAGTSMSAPQIAGVVGILRSINPLVTVGDPAVPSVLGIRNVLVNTSFEAQAGTGWNTKFGYGHPDAASAAKVMLGKADGVTVRNRATPLFTLYSSVAADHAYTTSPQFAMARIRNVGQSYSYQPQGALIAGYAAFPNDPSGGSVPSPRADIFVLSTENKPRSADPALVALYMLDRPRNFPLGCSTGAPGCNSNNDDYMLVATVGDLQQAVADGFKYRGIQGYVYQPCTPEPKCVPAYAQRLYQECKTAIDDCAIFLESARASMESQGFTSAYPSGSSKVMGYAFPNVDTDGDGLVDGFEYVIGTSPTLVDSNGDGANDGAQFPLASVSISDPCLGIHNQCPADDLFKNSFEL